MSRALFWSWTWMAILIIGTLSSLFRIVQSQRLTGIYIDNGMGQTIAHRASSRREKRAIARDILDMLQLPPIPSISASYSNESTRISRSASRYINDIYKTYSLNENKVGQLKNRGILDDSDVVVSYAASPSYLPGKSDVLLNFDLSETPREVEAVVGADLRIYLSPRKNSSVVTIHSLLRSKNKKNQSQQQRKRVQFIDSVEVNVGAEAWIEVDASKALRSWILRGDEAATLQLSIASPESDARHSLLLDEEPFLLGYFRSTAKLQQTAAAMSSRWKRSSDLLRPYGAGGNAIHRKPSSTSCRMHTLYVRFRELEFDRLIVAPDGYDAQFCAGECRFPLSGHHNATNHAIVQTLVHFLQPGRVPQACCVPTELDSLPVLYARDKGTLILKRYHNMVIKGCGCH